MNIRVEKLEEISSALVESLGAEREEAEIVSRILVNADLRGIGTHGLVFLPMIAERIEAGVLKVPTHLSLIKDDGAILHYDGGNGLGQPAAFIAMAKTIEKAKNYGLGLSLIKNTNHIGLLAYYSLMAAREGMIGFCACNGAASIAPWGGAEAFFGTNPFSLAAPREKKDPVVLDMSTSLVARGKIRRALKKGEPIPLGWALDKEGNPTADPKAAMEGTLVPIGGPKGSGMALFIDLICGMLSGSKYGKELLSFHQVNGPTGVGVAVMAIDISRFMPLPIFTSLAERYFTDLVESEKAPGVSRIYLPGEIEAEMERENREKGIPLDNSLIDSLNKLLLRKGIPYSIQEEN